MKENENKNEWNENEKKKMFSSCLVGLKMRGKENKDKDKFYCLF